MFRAKTSSGEWTLAWRLLVGKKNRAFLKAAQEKAIISRYDPEVWVTFQRTIKDDESIIEKTVVWFLDSSSCDLQTCGSLLSLRQCEEGAPFAIISKEKIGPQNILLITIVKKFREQDMINLGYKRNEDGEFEEDNARCRFSGLEINSMEWFEWFESLPDGDERKEFYRD
ncbi:MAG: hypothetical protein V1807_00160 [Patescibacteria group bacterium]